MPQKRIFRLLIAACFAAAQFAFSSRASAQTPAKDSVQKPADAAPAEATQETKKATKPEEPVEKEPDLPTLDKMELPSVARLLKGPAVDWIVLTGDKVMEVEPVYPRPGTMEHLFDKIKEHIKQVGQAPTKDEDKAKRLSLFYLPVTLPEGEEREFKLHRQHVKEIIHYEDLMLRRIDQLLGERRIRESYQVLAALHARQAN